MECYNEDRRTPLSRVHADTQRQSATGDPVRCSATGCRHTRLRASSTRMRWELRTASTDGKFSLCLDLGDGQNTRKPAKIHSGLLASVVRQHTPTDERLDPGLGVVWLLRHDGNAQLIASRCLRGYSGVTNLVEFQTFTRESLAGVNGPGRIWARTPSRSNQSAALGPHTSLRP
ncbi:hypothetical protein BD413DRAFT_578378 [Trametes elegans]|nr:hypothetical protein BD413DRAFT_578378 [Trametes elegans]